MRVVRARRAGQGGVVRRGAGADVSLAGGHAIESAAGDSVVVADFPIGSAELRPSTVAQLRSSWIGILERQSSTKYEFVGYSDCAGDGGRNTVLRQARAQAVAGLFPKTAARATADRRRTRHRARRRQRTPGAPALNRSVIIRLPPSRPPPPAPKPEPEEPGVVIDRREPRTTGCKRAWREMLSVAWPAARMMVEKALEMAYTGKGSVNTYLLERYFGPDATDPHRANPPGLPEHHRRVVRLGPSSSATSRPRRGAPTRTRTRSPWRTCGGGDRVHADAVRQRDAAPRGP